MKARAKIRSAEASLGAVSVRAENRWSENRRLMGIDMVELKSSLPRSVNSGGASAIRQVAGLALREVTGLARWEVAGIALREGAGLALVRETMLDTVCTVSCNS